jgi:hypothetical protein
MSDDSTVYSTKQVADRLGLGSAMVRKYAVALEKLTGEEIPLKRRDGRQFSPEHYAAIAHAKALVDSNNGLNVETALKMALAPSEMTANAPALSVSYSNTLELTEALTAAVAKGNEALLAEVRQLRQDLLESRPLQDSTIHSLTEPVVSESPSKESPIIRAARRLDDLLKKIVRF